MGANLSTSVCPTSQDAFTSTATWYFPHGELVALVEVVRSLAGNGEGLPPLVQVAAACSAGHVWRYLQEGGDLWARDTAGRTPLHWAAGVGSDRLVGALLALGADVGARDSRGKTPLHYAAVGGSAATVEILLKAGARNSAQDYQQRTPLMWAASVGDAPLCKLLTGGGLGLNVVDAADLRRQTALHLAAGAGQAAAVSVLLAEGASVNAVDVEGRVPLHCALDFYHKFLKGELQASHCPNNSDGRAEAYGEGGYPAEATRQVVVRLLTGAAKSTRHRDNRHMTPLMWALGLGLSTVARLLMDAHPPDYHTDELGKTALHWAARAGETHIVNRLLQLQFSPWRRDSKGCTPMMDAVKSRDVETVRALAKCGNLMSHRNEMGKRPLHIAVDLRDAVMVQCLLDLGATVGPVDRDGRTALFCALEMGEAGREIAQILMKAGGRCARRLDGRGRTLLHAAAAGGDVAMVHYLLYMGAAVGAVDCDGRTALFDALEKGEACREIAQILLHAGGRRTRHRDWRGRTLLHAAATGGDVVMVRYLLQQYSYSVALDDDGESPLSCALRLRHRAAAAELLQCSIELGPDRHGRTPLHWAAAAGLREEARVLHQAGCPGYNPDEDGRTAIGAASNNGHSELARELFEWAWGFKNQNPPSFN